MTTHLNAITIVSVSIRDWLTVLCLIPTVQTKHERPLYMYSYGCVTVFLLVVSHIISLVLVACISYHFSVLCFHNICLLLLIFIMYQYSCYACSIVYICKYCVCPHGPYGLLDVGIKVSIYLSIIIISAYSE